MLVKYWEDAEGSAIKASTPASFSAAARTDWRLRNSERLIGGTFRRETFERREDQEQRSRRPFGVRICCI